jgi:hypothetical protein
MRLALNLWGPIDGKTAVATNTGRKTNGVEEGIALEECRSISDNCDMPRQRPTIAESRSPARHRAVGSQPAHRKLEHVVGASPFL